MTIPQLSIKQLNSEDNTIHQVNLGPKQFPVLSKKRDTRTSFPTMAGQDIWHSIHLNEYRFWNETKSIGSFEIYSWKVLLHCGGNKFQDVVIVNGICCARQRNKIDQFLWEWCAANGVLQIIVKLHHSLKKFFAENNTKFYVDVNFPFLYWQIQLCNKSVPV